MVCPPPLGGKVKPTHPKSSQIRPKALENFFPPDLRPSQNLIHGHPPKGGPGPNPLTLETPPPSLPRGVESHKYQINIWPQCDSRIAQAWLVSWSTAYHGWSELVGGWLTQRGVATAWHVQDRIQEKKCRKCKEKKNYSEVGITSENS